jgi:hypothetical protein
MNKSRKIVKELSNVDELIKTTKEGETIMKQKVYFDKYLKAQV